MSPGDLLRLSDGEIQFFWQFIQGSIMNPETRWNLRDNWGMCDRHSFGFASVEAAYRHGFLMGQAVLYQDLMERAVDAFRSAVPQTIAFRLREKEKCLMCQMGYSLKNRTDAAPFFQRAGEGRNLEPIRLFAVETAPRWQERVCGICAGEENPLRCRTHFLAELDRDGADFSTQRELVERILKHLDRYMQSFVWDCGFDATLEDCASLIEAIGWLTGWKPWIQLLQENQ